MRRRNFLTGVPLTAASLAWQRVTVAGTVRPSVYVDMHTHLGVFGWRVNVRSPMMQNGMLLLVQKIVADMPVIRRTQGGGVKAVRDPGRGELYSYFEREFTRMRDEHERQALIDVVSADVLDAVVRDGKTAVVLAAEGGDFLEGELTRLENARRRGLVHLQLVHYRVSELGDISTERPVHHGLTQFGKEVIAACNRLGILVDVAHATSDGIAQALDVSTKPVLYSHGHVLTANPSWTDGGVNARAIHRPLAQKIAQRGGVIGIWPLGAQYRSLDAYADALIDTAEVLGAAHVGVGTDMGGLPSTVIPDYESFPTLAELLDKRGVSADSIRGMLGGNYVRVLREALNVRT